MLFDAHSVKVRIKILQQHAAINEAEASSTV